MSRHLSLVVLFAGAFGSVGPAVGQPQPSQPGVETLTRGPLHEAFATVTLYNPTPGPVVPKQPPEPIDEIAPDTKPEGDYIWISGYWAWDEERASFIWISGVWRLPPPGRTWMPGYWTEAGGGWQWVSGFWAPENVQTMEYLPAPPESLERGPSSPAPSASYFWAPGCWLWRGSRYIWRPGYWCESDDQWLWNPGYYACSPAGYVYVDGYWDYSIYDRGCAYAPVYFAEPYYGRRHRFIPEIVLHTSALSLHLFHRPSYSHYYFGDYYDPWYVSHGIYPWFSCWDRGYGYDSIFLHLSWHHRHHHGDWSHRVRHDYDDRVRNVDSRPPRTLAAQAERTANPNTPQEQIVATPIQQAVQTGSVTQRIEKLDESRRGAVVDRSEQLRARTRDRRQIETQARTSEPSATRGPRRVALPSSNRIGEQPRTSETTRPPIGASGNDRPAPTGRTGRPSRVRTDSAPASVPNPALQRQPERASDGAATKLDHNDRRPANAATVKQPAAPAERKPVPPAITKSMPSSGRQFAPQVPPTERRDARPSSTPTASPRPQPPVERRPVPPAATKSAPTGGRQFTPQVQQRTAPAPIERRANAPFERRATPAPTQQSPPSIERRPSPPVERRAAPSAAQRPDPSPAGRARANPEAPRRESGRGSPRPESSGRRGSDNQSRRSEKERK